MGAAQASHDKGITTSLFCHSTYAAGVQGWMGAVQVSRDKGITTAAVAAAAMFVLVVTRSNDEWSSWSEHDNMFVRCASAQESAKLACCSHG